MTLVTYPAAGEATWPATDEPSWRGGASGVAIINPEDIGASVILRTLTGVTSSGDPAQIDSISNLGTVGGSFSGSGGTRFDLEATGLNGHPAARVLKANADEMTSSITVAQALGSGSYTVHFGLEIQSVSTTNHATTLNETLWASAAGWVGGYLISASGGQILAHHYDTTGRLQAIDHPLNDFIIHTTVFDDTAGKLRVTIDGSSWLETDASALAAGAASDVIKLCRRTSWTPNVRFGELDMIPSYDESTIAGVRAGIAARFAAA